MAALHEPTAAALHVDLGAVAFMDSTALGGLITRSSADEVGERVVLDPVPQRVQRLIDLGGLNDLSSAPARQPTRAKQSQNPASPSGSARTCRG